MTWCSHAKGTPPTRMSLRVFCVWISCVYMCMWQTVDLAWSGVCTQGHSACVHTYVRYVSVLCVQTCTCTYIHTCHIDLARSGVEVPRTVVCACMHFLCGYLMCLYVYVRAYIHAHSCVKIGDDKWCVSKRTYLIHNLVVQFTVVISALAYSEALAHTHRVVWCFQLTDCRCTCVCMFVFMYKNKWDMCIHKNQYRKSSIRMENLITSSTPPVGIYVCT